VTEHVFLNVQKKGVEFMANLGQLSFALVKRHFSVRRLITFVSLIVTTSTMSNALQAGQVTFAFDATVTEVNETSGGANLLPFQPMVGQHMSGIVMFTPVPFGQTSGNDAQLEVDWEGETFTGSFYKLQTVND
jgi:hypothetical protein